MNFSGMSSAVRGLIPKSSGGRMALGAGGALGMAVGVAGYKNHRSNQRLSQLNREMDAFDRLPLSQRKQITLDSAYDFGQEHGDYMKRRIELGNFPTL